MSNNEEMAYYTEVIVYRSFSKVAKYTVQVFALIFVHNIPVHITFHQRNPCKTTL